ncbi:MAG: GntR family transcriptional regulator [Clostridia bacterium]|nr:GntR family transcriptional regulator [Clostridia bacterium]
MEFSFDNNMPIYVQIARIIEVKIISGEYSPGERLPSVRDLAITLKANPNTVQRALGDLEECKLIYTERTNGKFVTTDAALIKNHKTKYANMLANDYLNSMLNIGFDKSEAETLLKSVNPNKR